MLVSRTGLHIFQAVLGIDARFRTEILLPHVSLFRCAIGSQVLFMEEKGKLHRTIAVAKLLASEDNQRMN